MCDKIKSLQDEIAKEIEIKNIEHNRKNKKAKKLKGFFAVTFILAIVYFIYAVQMNTEYRKICRYVKSNEPELTKISEHYLSYDLAETYFDYSGSGAFQSGNNKIVQFNFSEKGIAPSTIFYGYYYSVNDEPAGYCGDMLTLWIEKDGLNRWHYITEGNNFGFTKRIKKNWFYFEFTT